MAVYLVEWEMGDVSVEALAAAQQAAIATSRRFTAAGTPVRYLRAAFLPAQARCFCLLEAPDPVSVREVHEAARLPYTRVVEALLLAR